MDTTVDLDDTMEFLEEVLANSAHERSRRSNASNPVDFTPIPIRHRRRVIISDDESDAGTPKRVASTRRSKSSPGRSRRLSTPRKKSLPSPVSRKKSLASPASRKTKPQPSPAVKTKAKTVRRRKSGSAKKEPATPKVPQPTQTRFGRSVRAPPVIYEAPKRMRKKKVEPTTPVKKPRKSPLSISTPAQSSKNLDGQLSPILPSTSAVGLATPKKLIWTSKNKRELVAAFETFNPATDNDWMEIVNLLKQRFTLEECKEQAKRMKLISSKPHVDKALEEAEARMRKLIPNGKIPQKGTIRREELEHEFITHVMRMATEKEQCNPLMDLLSESQEQIVLDAARDHALDQSLMDNRAEYEPRTPTRRIFMPQIFVNRSTDDSRTHDDSFALPDNTHEMRYMFKVMAERKGRQLAKKGHKIPVAVPDPVNDELSD